MALQRYARWRTAARLSPELEVLALKNKSCLERARKLSQSAEILVVAVALAGQQGMHRVMKIVAPDGVETVTGRSLANKRGIVGVRLGDDQDLAPKFASQRLHVLLDFRQDVLRGLVVNRLDSIEPQAIEVIFADPIKRIVDEIAADAG